jgi:hypothetical protein
MTNALPALLAILALGGAGPGAHPEPRHVKLGDAFDLAPGETARVDGPGLELVLEKIVADSRCAKGEQCVWAGDATVRLQARLGSGAKHTCEVRLSAEEATALGPLEFSARLVDLQPYPVAGRAIEPRNYRARLELIRGTDSPLLVQ